MPEAEFPTGNPTTLQPGDIAVLFTDGLLEAMSQEGDNKLFGPNRVIEVVARNREKSAGGIIAALYEAVTEFSGSKKLSDDITVVVIKVDGTK